MRRVCANAAARWAAYLEEVELAMDMDDDSDDEETIALSLDPGAGPVILH